MTETSSETTTGSTSADARGYGARAVFASAIGYAVDGGDNSILGFCLAGITVTFALSTTLAGLLSTLTLIGAVVGGAVFGVLADYFGRVRVLTWSILIFAVFTGLTALAWNYEVLVVFRVLSGLGFGGEFGIGMALSAEAFPAAKRAHATSWVGIGGVLGVLIADFVATAVIPAAGWRPMFAIGIVPALIAYFVRRRLHEPTQFVEITRGEKRREFPIRALFDSARSTRSTIGLSILTSVHNCGYYGLMTWLPFYLSERYHYSVTKSGLWTATTVAGMIVGIYVFGQLTERFGRKPIFLLFYVGSAVGVLVYAHLGTPMSLLIGGAVMGFFTNGPLGGYGAMISETFPTQARATAVNVTYNVGRGVGGFAPLIIGIIIGASGFAAALTLFAVLYVVNMLALFLVPDNRGAELV
ncbi:MAG TPA: MFS transporter [Trebonia sp.]